MRNSTPQEKASVAIDLLALAILEVIREKPGSNSAEIGRKLNINETADGAHKGWITDTVLRQLEADGLIANKSMNQKQNAWYLVT